MSYARLPHVPLRLDLATATDERLLMLYHRDGDAGARDEMVRRAMPFARRLASRYRIQGHHEDMSQAAAIGRMKAVEGDGPKRGVGCAAGAVPKILGELRRH